MSMAIRAAAVLLLLAGCVSDTKHATQVLLKIRAEGEALDATVVRVRVLGGLGGELSERRVADIEAGGDWPLEIAIEPRNGDASRTWRVEAWALDGSNELGAGSVSGAFEAGKLVERDLVLRPETDLGDIPSLVPTGDGGVPETDGAGDDAEAPSDDAGTDAEIDSGGDAGEEIDELPLCGATSNRTCAEVRANDGITTDALACIDVDGPGPGLPIEVYCVGMDVITEPPTEYLELRHSIATDERGSNFARYEGGGPYNAAVTTNFFARVRFNPDEMVIVTSDRRFATFEVEGDGSVEPAAGMPFGTAGDCMSSGAGTGIANIDLRGTGLAVSDDATFEPIGYLPRGVVEDSNAKRTVFVVRGGGYCGAFGPAFDDGIEFPGSSELPVVLRLDLATSANVDGGLQR